MRKLLFSLAAAGTLAATAAVPGSLNSPGVDGYMARGRMMLADKNFEGCLDQMNSAVRLGASGATLEEARWMMVLSAAGLDEDGALEGLRQWMAQYPASPLLPTAQMKVGDLLFASADYDEAVKAYDQVDPKTLDAVTRAEMLYRRSYSLMMLDRYDEAAAGFSALTADRTWRNAALFYLGYIDYARGNYADALEQFAKVDTSTAPGNTAPYYMAQIYYMESNSAKALEYARRALSSDLVPSMATESKRIAGESLYAMGDREGAVAYLWDYAANTDNPAPSAFYILGVSEWTKGDYAAASKLMQQATAADNAMGQSAWLYLGQCYLQRGLSDQALMAFEKAYKMPYDADTRETAFYNYAVARTNGGAAPFGSTASVMEDFLKEFPQSRYRAGVQRHMVSGYLSDGDYEGALRHIDAVSNPDTEMLEAKQRALFGLGMNAAKAGDAAKALACFRDCRAVSGLSGSDTALQALLWEGDCQYALGDTDAAIAAYRKYLQQAPDNDENRSLAQYNLGYALYGRHDYADAEKEFSKAVNGGALGARMAADARNRMGDCLAYLGEYSRAEAQYRAAAELSPSTADYSLYQTAMMKGYGAGASASNAKLNALDAMVTRFPDSPYVPDALLEKGTMLSAAGDIKGAAATYSRILKDWPNTAQGRRAALLLAIDSRGAGRPEEAIAAYQRVISAYPSSEEARIATDDLKNMMAAADRLDEYVAFMASVPGAPSIDDRDIDMAAFRAAERAWLDNADSSRLLAYLGKYPGGVYEAEALFYLAQEADTAGNADDVVRYTRRVADNHPTSTVAEDAMAMLARTLMNRGDEDEALDIYRRLADSASSPANLLDARMGIMTNALRKGDNATVIEISDKVLATADLPTAKLLETRFMRGLALSREGRAAEAESEWALAAASTSDASGCKSAVYLAQSILDRGDAKGAAAAANRFIDAKPAEPYWLARGFIVLSDALRAQGNSFEADQYLKTLRDNYPGQQPDIFMMIEERLLPNTDKDKK